MKTTDRPPFRPAKPVGPPPPDRPTATIGTAPRPRPASKRVGGPPLAPVVLAVAGLLGLTVFGASYYFASPPDRVRHHLHTWLRPSGYVGQAAGILALFIFLFLWLYPLRKKVRWLRWTGAMAAWLNVHVAAALVLPVLTAVHASWRFDGLIGLGYWSMIVVCASGVIGRFLYVQIPRSASGLELTVEEIAAERRTLLGEIAERTSLAPEAVEGLLPTDPTPCEGLGLGATIRQMVRDEVIRWRAAKTLRRQWAANASTSGLDRVALQRVVRLATREMALTQQVRLLGATHRLFHLWHVAHRPFAVAALVAVLVHVGVVVAMGMTWVS